MSSLVQGYNLRDLIGRVRTSNFNVGCGNKRITPIKPTFETYLYNTNPWECFIIFIMVAILS